MPLPKIIPIALAQLPAPFDHPDWLFEVYDGFRALAYLERGAVQTGLAQGERV